MDILGYELGEILTRQAIYILVIFIIGVILLHVATIILDFRKKSFGKAAWVLILGSIIAFFLAFIPYIGRLLGLIGYWFLIKSFYDVSWFKAIIAWIMSIVVAFIVALVVLILFDVSILFIPKL